MKTMKVRITGNSPILMHNGRLANPLDPAAKTLKALTSRKKKTDSDHAEIARSEWEGGLYIDTSGPYISCDNMDACIKGGAKLQKLGKQFGSSVAVVEDRIPLQFDGPRDANGLWAAGFYDVRGVRIGQTRVQRCRPLFRTWTATFSIAFDDRDVEARQIEQALHEAGRLVGLFDRRPEKGGRFGKFTAEVIA